MDGTGMFSELCPACDKFVGVEAGVSSGQQPSALLGGPMSFARYPGTVVTVVSGDSTAYCSKSCSSLCYGKVVDEFRDEVT